MYEEAYAHIIIPSFNVFSYFNVFSNFFLGVGSYYLDACPLERMIPIFLIVFGVGNALSILLAGGKKHMPETAPKHLRIAYGILGLFQFAWFIAGNVWVYR